MPIKSKGARQSDFSDTCSRCKTHYRCCLGTRPPLSSKRRKIIEKYLKERTILIENPFVQEAYFYPRENVEGYCIFHNQKTRRCLIHPVKPETCVAGPVTFDLDKRKGKVEWYIKMERICSLAGVVYRDEVLLRKHVKAAEREILRLVKELDAEALNAILAKEEPETFKIGEDDVSKEVLDKLAPD